MRCQASVVMGADEVELEWDDDALDAPGWSSNDGSADLVSGDGIACYPLNSIDGKPAWDNGVYKIWADDGYLHRLDGPAKINDNGAEEWWAFGIEFQPEILQKHIERLRLLEAFVHSEGLGWREFDGSEKRVMDLEDPSGIALLQACESGKITVIGGPRGFETEEVVDFTTFAPKTNSSISGVHVAAGAAGLIGLLAFASKAKTTNQQRKVQAEVQK